MNATNRGANRGFLLLTGLLLLAAAAAAVVLAVAPEAAQAWPGAIRALAPAWSVTPVAGADGWAAIVVGAAAAILVVLLAAFAVRQGRGHTSTVVDRPNGEHGRTRVDVDIPRSLLTAYLEEHPDVLATRVTAYAVRGTPALKVSIRARRGASPAQLSRDVVTALTTLDDVLGVRLPALVQVSGGFRARTAGRARVA